VSTIVPLELHFSAEWSLGRAKNVPYFVLSWPCHSYDVCVVVCFDALYRVLPWLERRGEIQRRDEALGAVAQHYWRSQPV